MMFFKGQLEKIKQKAPHFEERDYDDFLEEKIGFKKEEQAFPMNPVQLEHILEKVLSDIDDFQKRVLSIPSGQHIIIFSMGGLVNQDLLYSTIVEPFILRIENGEQSPVNDLKQVLYSAMIREPTSWKDLIQAILDGKAICHVEGMKPAVIPIETTEKRNISPPETEYQVYGPKSGFVEDFATNVALLRRFIRDPRFKAKQFEIGSLSHNKVAMLYLEEYADPDLCREVEKRIKSVETDTIIQAGHLGKKIKDSPMSVFPLTSQTERPDRAAFALSQGKVVIVVDNSTFVLYVPTTLIELYETSEENYDLVWNTTFIRLLRLVCLFIATMLPSLYVALVGFHPELLPAKLALTMTESRSNIPLPAPAEALLMMFALDVLVESSIRLPSFVGQTIGIVGGIVIGTAAVEAGIVSSLMIIIVSITAIASFTVPTWSLALAWRIVRYGFLMITSILGIYGLMLGVILVTIHLCHLQSFGKPYLSPLSPLNAKQFYDVFIRFATRKDRST
ncbi:spore germination protein [Desertibacillus haloalkaliphilus]|uniref:spore germination protein n=1 Tax=Desertibacillus haloalkaliphilus TaxID=1328930 RepID=UPI001C25F15A|nr:spore germination protein [Desertibacillus haloalkaliphilus]MBU8906874.1 spore germination protein [Desertibacillus haloalkaliphilus]